jgi:hypothetical protein
MSAGGEPDDENDVEESALADKPVFHRGVVNLCGEKFSVPGGVHQHVLKGCLAIPVRDATLRVFADKHGFTGDFVTEASEVKMFNLSTVVLATPEPRFVEKDVSYSMYGTGSLEKTVL